MMSFVFTLAAISVDYSWWLSDRRGVARAADLSALAAVQDLPADPANHEYITLTAGCAAVTSCAAAF
jgi:Flp pilus assembly protein TadG